jgi:hypothetical protein
MAPSIDSVDRWTRAAHPELRNYTYTHTSGNHLLVGTVKRRTPQFLGQAGMQRHRGAKVIGLMTIIAQTHIAGLSGQQRLRRRLVIGNHSLP